MAKYKFDRYDKRILEELQKNGRISNVDLAAKVGLSPAPCLRRVRDMEEAGVIKEYVAVLDQRAVGISVNAFIAVELNSAAMPALNAFEREVRKLPEVVEAYVLTGDWDYIVHVLVPDLDAFEAFLRNHLSQVPGVMRLRSSFALRSVKQGAALPLNYIEV